MQHLTAANHHTSKLASDFKAFGRFLFLSQRSFWRCYLVQPEACFRWTKSGVGKVAWKNASLKDRKAQKRLLNPPALTFQATSGTLVPIRENSATPGESTCSCISRVSHMHTCIHPLTLKHHCCTMRLTVACAPWGPPHSPRHRSHSSEAELYARELAGDSSLWGQSQQHRFETPSFVFKAVLAAVQPNCITKWSCRKKNKGGHNLTAL